jgi:hypothetical protein
VKFYWEDFFYPPYNKQMYKILYNEYKSPVILDNRRFGPKTLEDRLAGSQPQGERGRVRENYEPRLPQPSRQSQESFVEYDVLPPPPQQSFASQSFAKPPSEENDSSSHFCSDVDGEKNVCGAGKNLYAIMDPRFNLREMAGNMILLEDHLFHEGKRCEDCIKKHLMTIDFLGSEAITLDKGRKYADIISKTNSEFRQFFKDLARELDKGTLTDEDCCQLAQNLRKIRKPLCQQFATFIQ